MKTALVNEEINKNGTVWSVSFDGFNTTNNSQTVIVANCEEAFKLKGIVDDLKEKLAFLAEHISYRIEDNESDMKLNAIVDNMKLFYL